MYNQVNHGPQTPIPPAYQQCPQVPPPPPHFRQGPPGPPVQHVPTAVPPHIGLSAPHVYIRGPPGPSSTVPLIPSVQVPSSLVQNTGQSYVIPRPPLHGNSMMPQTFSSFGQNSQHSSNMGVHPNHIPPVPPPPLSHPQQDTSWAPGPHRGLPPLPPPPPSSHSQGQTMYQPPLPPCPPQPGDVQSLQCIPPPPPAPSTSGFHAPTPDGVYLHASVGNFPPPLPSSPPPILPSPPPLASPMTSASNLSVSNLPGDLHSEPLASPMTFAFSLAVSNLPGNLHSEPKSSRLFSSELKAIDSVDKVVASELSGIAPSSKESGSSREIAIANTDELLSTRNAMLDLPPPPCRPTEDKIVQKIEALCQLIAGNGPGIEDKTRQDEHKNPEYAFLFGGDPGTEAAISHEFFLWMKKKCILEHEWHDEKSESQLRPLAVNSLRQHDHRNVATECNFPADSDMEMEG